MRRVLCTLLIAATLASCQRADANEKPNAQMMVYPEDITPPAGTQYPCALTALPKDLKGIPRADRDYINRTYALILRATQAKLVMLKALQDPRNIGSDWQRYEYAVLRYQGLMRQDKVPPGLESFRDDVLAALDLQRAFFLDAWRYQQSGRTMEQIYAIPSGRQASERLISAWGRMQSRYPDWDQPTKDSIYHHLCALDLF